VQFGPRKQQLLVSCIAFEVLTAVVVMSTIFRDITPRSFGGTLKMEAALFANCFMMGSCLYYSSTLEMEAKCSSGKGVGFQRTT
jgi:hypothetical protein